MKQKTPGSKRYRTSFKKQIGQIPGALVYTGKKKGSSTIEAFEYNAERVDEIKIDSVEQTFKYRDSLPVSWINLDGLNDVDVIEKLGNHYNLHPLILEDIVNVNQRPKIDEFENYLFVVVKMLYFDEFGKVVVEQVSFILGKNYVISFQEADGDVFNNVRDRLRQDKGRIRKMSADYLLYALIDAIVDQYFIIIETIGDKIETLETQLFDNQSQDDIVMQIQGLKREILRVRRAIFPLREVVSKIEKHSLDLISPGTITYFNDIYDNIIQISDFIDIYREMIWSMMDMHMTTLSNKMNEVMKVLTVSAAIFIPLTFLAGIYGMNFKYIPELDYKYGYFILIGIMAVIVLLLLYFFRRKKWL